MSEFEKLDLGDGVRLFVHPTTKFKTVSARAYVHRPLGGEATGTSLLSNVLARGCRRTPTMRAITVFLEDLYGATCGSSVFKMGEQQVLAFSVETINDRYTPRKIGAVRKAVEFLGRLIAQPVLEKGGFRAEFVAQEKENLRRAIEGLVNDRGAYAYERCLAAMCRDEPFGIYEYGRVEDIAAITPRSLRELHVRALATSPVDVFVVGDVSPPRMASMVSGAMRLRRNGVAGPPTPVERPAPNAPREIVETMDVEQGNLVLGARTGIRWADDDAIALSVANGVFGAFPHSKLFANVRERDNLAYSVYSWIDLTKGVLFVAAGIDFANKDAALRTIQAELAAVQAGQVSDDELEKTRASLVDRVRSRGDSPSSMVGVFHEMLWHGRVETSERLIERYRAVTKEDVARAAKKVRLDTVYFLTKK
jgi:predicted Zn-dependent peptidase